MSRIYTGPRDEMDAAKQWREEQEALDRLEAEAESRRIKAEVREILAYFEPRIGEL